jgi:cytochrome c-type biogenesis protein CcsB
MKHLRFLFTPIFMAVIMIVLAVAMAAATFIENDFGPDAARAIVYGAHWFELLFLLLIINLTGQIVLYRLYRKAKMTVMLFHTAFIIMVVGAAITRYTGYDGMMHIREGETSNVTYAPGGELTFRLLSADGEVLADHSAAFSPEARRNNRFNKRFEVEGRKIALTFERYIPGAVKQVADSPDGVPMVSFLCTPDMVTSEIVTLAAGETGNAGEMTVGFDRDADIIVSTDSTDFFVASRLEMRATNMQDMQSQVYSPGTPVVLTRGTVYTVGGYRLMPQKMTMSGTIVPVAGNGDPGSGGAIELRLTGAGTEKSICLWDDDSKEPSQWRGQAGNLTVLASYGSRTGTLPFSLKLDDFVVERYPGSDSPSGFISRVSLEDPSQGLSLQYDIYMNHILKYRGYRFYQSSYDSDEMGTVLSVNHDPAGMYTTYTGYALLFLFIILTLINRKSFFISVTSGYWKSWYRKPLAAAVLLLLVTAVPAGAQSLVIDRSAADSFGEVLVQDQKGRTEPLYTISSDILRKVAGEKNLDGLSPMQVFLGCYLDFYHWQNVPLIKVSNDDLRQVLRIEGEKAAFSDIVTFGEAGGYKLSSYVEKAYAKGLGERNRFDKEVIKVDERVNICYMMSRGDFLRIFPLRDGTDHWGTAGDAVKYGIPAEDSLFVTSAIPLWVRSVTSVGRRDTGAADYLRAVKEYQKLHTGYNLPPERKIKAELFYYRANIFEKLFPWYTAIGLLMIVAIITFIIRGREYRGVLMYLPAGLIAAGFLFHTLGLGIRWYISGHSPMSNGYESMLFISWVTVLAGFIFSRRSMLTLAATSVLGGLTLMVAHLSFMDPEITNLVPVLKSYWLTLHVSVITGSYGFLALGAILGLIVLVMILFVNKKNVERIGSVIDELTVINYRTVTLGLYLLTIGTFLGAIWANESWGRYWGWDPKETWSLITIVVYTLVTHSRMIPAMKNIYSFNLLSLIAFSSVLMTYFGVNYYLSGLHSYAGGDPVPVPVFVYIAVILVVLIAAGAGYMYRQSADRRW